MRIIQTFPTTERSRVRTPGWMCLSICSQWSETQHSRAVASENRKQSNVGPREKPCLAAEVRRTRVLETWLDLTLHQTLELENSHARSLLADETLHLMWRGLGPGRRGALVPKLGAVRLSMQTNKRCRCLSSSAENRGWGFLLFRRSERCVRVSYLSTGHELTHTIGSRTRDDSVLQASLRLHLAAICISMP